MLLPFQKLWVTDNSRLKLCVKARQVGLSWITAYSLIRRKLGKGARLDAWISSRDEIQARLFLEDAKRFAAVFNAAADSLGQNVCPPGRRSYSTWNGYAARWQGGA